MAQFHRPMTEWPERRRRFQGMDHRGPNEVFVRRKVFQLSMNEGEELLFKRRLLEARIVAHGGHRRIDFLLEEVQRNVVLALEVIKDRAFGDPRLPRNRLGSRRVKPFRLKQTQRRFHNLFADRLFGRRAIRGYARLRSGLTRSAHNFTRCNLRLRFARRRCFLAGSLRSHL